MNDKIKSFFVGVGVGLAAVGSFVLGIVLSGRDDRSSTGQAGGELREAERTGKRAEDTNRKLGESVEDSKRILEEIRKNKLER